MTGKPRIGGLGRGLGALIPTAAPRDTSDEQPNEPAPDSSPDAATAAPPAPTTPATSAAPPTDPDAPSTDPDREVSPAASAELVPVVGAEFAELPLDQIRANAKQPRQVFDEDALAELTHSVREFGVLQPVVVRPLDTGYEL